VTAETLAILAAGTFFLTALLTGIWKYMGIASSDDGLAHPYVDVCHRAALLYSFAAMLLAEFARISQLPRGVELVATGLVLFYFASAIVTYALHGWLKDTENQLKPPFVLGTRKLSSGSVAMHMWMLIAAEVGGFLVLFYGVVIALV